MFQAGTIGASFSVRAVSCARAAGFPAAAAVLGRAFMRGLAAERNAQVRTMLKQSKQSSNPLQPGATAFAITKRELDERTSVISVEGELDLSTAPRLKWMLVDSLEAGGSEPIVDLSLATFMDSTALGVLVGVNRRPELNGPLTIVCERNKVLRIFEFSGTDGAFAIYPTLEDALARSRAHTVSAG
jgi:anti-sigma B factor antagonist